ncbi:uncharacterized protein NPIL_628521, partial [Nephila pilipes]
KNNTKSFKGNQYSIPNDIIPSSNKRCCQSFGSSDSDDLPDLEELLEECNTPKVDDDQSLNAEKCQKRSLSPIAPGRKIKETKISENVKNNESSKQNIDIVSIISPSIVSENLASVISMRNSSNDQNVEKSTNLIKKNNAKNLKLKQNPRINLDEKKLKNCNIALRNKTNELINVVDSAENKKVAMKIQKTDKKIDSVVEEEKKTRLNSEVIKENKKVEAIDLFLSPSKEINCQNDLVNSSDNHKKSKIIKKAVHSKSRNKSEKNINSAEEHLILSLNEAENFELTVSKNTIPSIILESNIAKNKESFNLDEINLPDLNNTQDHISDNIADTAISVQTVDSPKSNKTELSSRSPGWSKVKQVGKDFRVKKFSRLPVEKNSSNCYLTEVTNVDMDLNRCNISTNESKIDECSKLKKFCDNSISKDICPDFSQDIQHKSSLFNDENLIEQQDAGHIKITSEKAKNIKIEAHARSLRETDDHLNVETVVLKNNKMESLETNERKSKSDKFYEIHSDKNNFKNNSGSCDFPNKPFITDQQNNEVRMLPIECGNSLIDDRTNPFQAVDNMSTNSQQDVQMLPISIESNERLNSNDQGHNNDNQNGSSKLGIEYFDTDNETVKFSVKQMSSNDVPVVKEMLLQTLHNPKSLDKNDANKSFNDCFDDKEIINMNNNSPSEEVFLKPNLKILPKTDVRKEILLSKFSKISKCEITATESVNNEDDNIYYAEHSQQTSQRLLEYGDNIHGQQNPFLDYVAPMNEPLHCTTKLSTDLIKFGGVGSKRESWSHQVEKFDLARFMLCQQKTEKTKVLKRTCLTLEEIQETFAKSNMSGTSEAICSLPFLSGEYRLHVCVSEETLNISVLKVLEVPSDATDIVPSKSDTLLVSEKNIQTSNNNSPLKSPIAIFPSSNAESENSIPDQTSFDDNVRRKNVPFPYLNKYFSDSESTEQLLSPNAKESCLNDSEIFPYFKPLSSDQCTNKNERNYLINSKIVNENDTKKEAQNIFQNSNHVGDNIVNSMKEMIVNKDIQSSSNLAEIDDNFQNLPPTQLYLGNKNSLESYGKKCSLDGTSGVNETVAERMEDHFSSNENASNTFKEEKNKAKELEEKNKTPEKIASEIQLSNDEVKSIASSASDDNANFDSISLYKKTGTACSDYAKLVDSEGLSTDPHMAFASELVAPLKNIAIKMKAEENNETDCQEKQGKRKIPPEMPVLSKENSYLVDFEELVTNMNKNSSANNSTLKASRLSLKSKRNMKKFKRIKKYDSDDDSDSSHSSKSELHASNHSTKNVAHISLESEKTKNKESSEYLQEQSTLNSFFSEDITNMVSI